MNHLPYTVNPLNERHFIRVNSTQFGQRHIKGPR